MTPTTIGIIAGTLTSVAAIPQVIKTVQTRNVRDISIWQPLLLAFGVALWMLYGILINDMPLILANITPLICNVALTCMKIHFGKHDCSSLSDKTATAGFGEISADRQPAKSEPIRQLP